MNSDTDINTRLATLAAAADKGVGNAQTDLEMLLVSLYRAKRLIVVPEEACVRDLLVQHAVNAASRLFDVHIRDIYGPYRFQFCTRARFAAFVALHRYGLAFRDIGIAMNRDSKSVANGVERGGYMEKRDPEYADAIARISRSLHEYNKEMHT